VTPHAVLRPGHDADTAIQAVRDALHQQFSFSHVTVQLDGVVCAKVDCEPPPPAASSDRGYAHE
jgi:hypothetical protein